MRDGELTPALAAQQILDMVNELPQANGRRWSKTANR